MIIKACDFCRNTDRNTTVYDLVKPWGEDGAYLDYNICDNCLKKIEKIRKAEKNEKAKNNEKDDS